MDKIKHSKKRDFFICQNMIFDLDISEHAKISYAYLSRCSDDAEQAFPSYNTIGKKCSFSRSTAIKAVKELKNIGLLSSECRTVIKDNKKTNTSNMYTLYDSPQDTSVATTPPPSVVATSPPVSKIHHPSPSDTPNKYLPKNTYSINTQSISHIQSPNSKQGPIDGLNQQNEITLKHTIPLEFTSSLPKMQNSIRYFSSWHDKFPKGYDDEFKQTSYKLLVDSLIEMATSLKTMNFRGISVSSVQVVEKINECISTDQLNNLDLFIDETIDDFITGNSNTEVKAPKEYMKTCIWNSFSTYKVKYSAYFHRTYYNSLAD